MQSNVPLAHRRTCNRGLELLLQPTEDAAAPLSASSPSFPAGAAAWKECGATGYHGYSAPQVRLSEQEMGSAAACHSTQAKHCVKTKWSVNPNKLWVVSSKTLIGPGFGLLFGISLLYNGGM